MEEFRYPEITGTFNWVHDWFDVVAAEGNDRPGAGRGAGGRVLDLAHLRHPARRGRGPRGHVAAPTGWGVRRGDAVIVMLGNRVELWEAMLAVMRLGAVVMPTTTAVGAADLTDRIERGGVRHVVVDATAVAKFDGVPGDWTRISVGGGEPGVAELRRRVRRRPGRPRGAGPPGHAGRPLLLYFTSGTTSRPKLVEHTQVSYPVGRPVDDVLAGAAPRRRAPQPLLGRLGQARVVLLLRAVDRRGHHRGAGLRALRAGPAARPAARPGRDHLLRPADGLADAHQVRPGRRPGAAARADRGGRAAQPPRSSRRCRSSGG